MAIEAISSEFDQFCT